MSTLGNTTKDSKYGSRKFLAFVTTVVLTFGALVLGSLSGANVVSIMLILIPSYMTSNVVARFADERSKKD